MNQSTRRGFLALTGTGVAAVAVAPSALAAGSSGPSPTTDAASSGRMVAYVHDAATGEVAVMLGEREVIVRDRALVAQLAKHLRS